MKKKSVEVENRFYEMRPGIGNIIAIITLNKASTRKAISG